MSADDKNSSWTTGPLGESAMQGLASRLAQLIKPPLIIYLQGDLGAGKTTFTRAFIRSLGYTGSVKSPTYGLLEDYPLETLHVVHLDLYRIEQSGELEFLGLEDLYHSKAVFMIEWPDHGSNYLPKADLSVLFEHSGEQRVLKFIAYNGPTEALINGLAE
jgi:tRNA threonylcarbamoyladenosine biosynthesis protein TsaE